MWYMFNVLILFDDFECYWVSQCIMVVMFKDLCEFDGVFKCLFDWDMVIIDIFFVENLVGGYCVVVKDECYFFYNWMIGKIICMSCVVSLFGFYFELGLLFSLVFCEVFMLICVFNGQDWYFYYEQYVGISYGLLMVLCLEGLWIEVWGNLGIKEWN